MGILSLKPALKWAPQKISAWTSVLAVTFLAVPALATLNFVSVDGVSNKDLTVATKPIIYAGITQGCTTDSNGANTSTCDSCTGLPQSSFGNSKIWTCNKTNAYLNLKVTLVAQTTTAGFTISDLSVKTGTASIVTQSPTLAADGTLTVQMTWADICSAMGKQNCADDGTAAGAGTVSGDIEVTLKNSTTTETLTIPVRVRKTPATFADTYYTDCGNGTVSANYGGCHFVAERGDEKVYASDLVFSEGYPDTSSISGIPYTNVLFFYESQPDGVASDTDIIASITNASSYISLSASSAADPPIADNRVTGLSNENRYCFLMANQDATGVISYFTPNSALPAEICATPSKVVGLLDDKHCFIATAAFGSEMAPEVQSFREFRNRFLLTNPIGRTFVKAYYEHSPYYAELISKSEIAKGLVRIALWPLLLFAKMSVVFGFWITLALAALGVVTAYEVYRRFIVGYRYRGEL